MKIILTIVLFALFALSIAPAVHAAAPSCGTGETGRQLTSTWSLTSDKQPPALTVSTSNARVTSVLRSTTSITVWACVTASGGWSITVSDGTQSRTWMEPATTAQTPNEAVQRLAPPERRADITK